MSIAWAAGIFEGEGWCGTVGGLKRRSTTLVEVRQKDLWLLERFKSLFGGSISYNEKHYEDKKDWQEILLLSVAV